MLPPTAQLDNTAILQLLMSMEITVPQQHAQKTLALRGKHAMPQELVHVFISHAILPAKTMVTPTVRLQMIPTKQV